MTKFILALASVLALAAPGAATAAPLPAPSPHGAVTIRQAAKNTVSYFAHTAKRHGHTSLHTCHHTYTAGGQAQPGSAVCTWYVRDLDGLVLHFYVQTVDTGGGHLVYGQVDKPTTRKAPPKKHATGLIWP